MKINSKFKKILCTACVGSMLAVSAGTSHAQWTRTNTTLNFVTSSSLGGAAVLAITSDFRLCLLIAGVSDADKLLSFASILQTAKANDASVHLTCRDEDNEMAVILNKSNIPQ